MEGSTQQEGTESKQPERTISVGQEFNLVSPDASIPSNGGPIAKFTLRIEGLNIPLTALIVPAEGMPLLITPFNLKVSDYIDARDYNPEERKLKLEELSSVGLSPEVKKNLFRLEIGEGSNALNEAGLNKKTYIPKAKQEQEEKPEKQKLLSRVKSFLQRAGNYQKETTNLDNAAFEGYNKFPPETRRILERLRLSLVFPNRLFFEAMPTDYMLDGGEIKFDHHYPRDFGPLPTVDVNKGAIYEGLHKGYYLGVPADPDKLSQIKAKFFLMDEQPQDASSVSQAKT